PAWPSWNSPRAEGQKTGTTPPPISASCRSAPGLDGSSSLSQTASDEAACISSTLTVLASREERHGHGQLDQADRVRQASIRWLSRYPLGQAARRPRCHPGDLRR